MGDRQDAIDAVTMLFDFAEKDRAAHVRIREEADAAHVRARSLKPAQLLSGYDWFEWGMRRALAIVEGTDQYDLTAVCIDGSRTHDFRGQDRCPECGFRGITADA